MLISIFLSLMESEVPCLTLFPAPALPLSVRVNYSVPKMAIPDKYFLHGRKDSSVDCPHCHAYTAAQSWLYRHLTNIGRLNAVRALSAHGLSIRLVFAFTCKSRASAQAP